MSKDSIVEIKPSPSPPINVWKKRPTHLNYLITLIPAHQYTYRRKYNKHLRLEARRIWKRGVPRYSPPLHCYNGSIKIVDWKGHGQRRLRVRELGAHQKVHRIEPRDVYQFEIHLWFICECSKRIVRGTYSSPRNICVLLYYIYIYMYGIADWCGGRVFGICS